MGVSDKKVVVDHSHSGHSTLIPEFLYSSSLLNKKSDLPHHDQTTSSSRSSFAIPRPNEKKKKIELYSPAFFAAGAIGGMVATGPTHMAVTPLDVAKCNMQVYILTTSTSTSIPLFF